MRVFLAFAREAMDYAINSYDSAWSDRELDQRCRDFLLSIVVDAWEDKGKDLGVRKMASSTGWGYSINDDAKRKLESSPEWKQYRELLLAAHEARSVRADEGNSQSGGTAHTTPTTCNASAAYPATKPALSDVKSEGVIRVKKRRRPKPTSKRNSRYEKIDDHLREIAKSQPDSHADVFRQLDAGRVPLPDTRVFAGSTDWSAGFRSNPAGAHAWLSQNWGRLNLPPFARGSKSSR
jgi:hypothetical protein